MFIRTTAINKLLAMKARKRVVQGSTSAGKTYGIIPCLIDKAAKMPKLRITVVAESIPAVKAGAVLIFKDVMHDTGRWVEDRWIRNPMDYTFANGSIIEFRAFDTTGKAKAAGKRDILFINEGNHISFDIADALMIRSKEAWIDYNPDNEFWAHTEVLTEPNSEFLLLTYLDNEALPEETLEDLLIKRAKGYFNPEGDLSDKKNIKNEYWANWWRVYGMGETGNLEGVIFSNWKIIDRLPEDARRLGTGLDFGFSNDPTAIIDVYKWNDKRVLDEICYATGLVNSEIAKILDKSVNTYADSAEPKSIEEIKLMGYRIYPTMKGADSVNYGIQLMQDQEYLVTARSLNLIKELRNYRWAKDKKGVAIDKPIDTMNHTIDAVRYHEMMDLKQKRLTRLIY